VHDDRRSPADVAVVWAQTADGVRGFLVPAATPGFSAPAIKHKLSLRASVTSELVLDGVRLPGDAALPAVTGLKGPLLPWPTAAIGANRTGGGAPVPVRSAAPASIKPVTLS
jgi:alkylation response protein AidB-like acyl-CoA dehydrogenase